MTEILSPSKIQLQIGYDKFLALRLKMAQANKKYRATPNGKQKTNIMHKIWLDNHKTEEYMRDTNEKAKARYHKRKALRLALLAELKLAENDISSEENSLGDSF